MPARRDGTEPMIAHGVVYLRPAEREDIPLFVGWFTDWRTTRTLALRAPMSLASEEQWFERMLADQGKGGYFFVACLLEDDRPIGTIGLYELDLADGSAGLGIAIGAPEDRGRGFGTDMLRALLAFGFGSLRLERIWLDVYDFNPGARRVYERVGFVHEGVLRHAVFREGRYVDVHRMAILADEWRARWARTRAPLRMSALPSLGPRGEGWVVHPGRAARGGRRRRPGRTGVGRAARAWSRRWLGVVLLARGPAPGVPRQSWTCATP